LSDRADQKRNSRALPITLTIVIAAVWFNVLDISRLLVLCRAGSSRSYAEAMDLARMELQLRVVGLKRCAGRIGHLPRTLAECAADMPRFQALLDLDGPRKRGWQSMVDEPWHPDPDHKPVRAAQGEGPPPELDFLGLPIRYRPGPRPDGTWVHSDDALVPAVRKVVKASGGVPSGGGPFALASLFLQHRDREQRTLDHRASSLRAVQFGGLLGLILAGVLVSVRWRGRPVRDAGVASITLCGVLALLVTAGSCASLVPCFGMVSFCSSRSGRHERLEILEQGVKRGEIPEEVARTARRYIGELPGRRW